MHGEEIFALKTSSFILLQHFNQLGNFDEAVECGKQNLSKYDIHLKGTLNAPVTYKHKTISFLSVTVKDCLLLENIIEVSNLFFAKPDSRCQKIYKSAVTSKFT